MEPLHVAVALSSALLHAGWNAVVKASQRPSDAMTAQMITSAIIVVPLLGWTGVPAPAAWPWIAASTGFNLLTVNALLRAYEVLGFGLAYPMVRALTVLGVVPLSVALTGEAPSLVGLAGIALVCLSLLMLGIANAGPGAVTRVGTLWIAVSGLTSAAYVMCDARGVRLAGSALAYGCMVSITNALAMSWTQKVFSRPWRTFAVDLARILPTSIAAVVSYLSILWVWSVAPVAPATALRDTSAIFAILIAVLWLKEPLTLPRLLAVLLAAVAIPMLRFA
jgi:drug/metabolite transporter (DMT)-like permease